MDDEHEKTIYRNGHAFRLDLERSRTDHAYIACLACHARADGPLALRQCAGVYVFFRHGISDIAMHVEIAPKGRKPIRETVGIHAAAIAELGRFFAAVGADDYGHAFWHWSNADRDYPCSTCPSPLGDAVRRLEDMQRDAIDIEPAVPKLPAGEST